MGSTIGDGERRTPTAAAMPHAAALSSRLASIDMLRALAALAVVFRHLPFSKSTGMERDDAHVFMAFSNDVMRVASLGQYGVQVFLVLSGFCIHMAWARKADAPTNLSAEFFPFWRRRLGRLYPPYLVTLVLCAAALLLITRLSHAPVSSFASYFGYKSGTLLAIDSLCLLLLVNNFGNASARFGNPPFWSLALEEQLYALYFPLVWMRRRSGWKATWMMVLSVVVVWDLTMLSLSPMWMEWTSLGPSLWVEWALGALAVEAYLGRTKLPELLYAPWLAAAAGVAGLLLVPPMGDASALSAAADQLACLCFGFATFVLVNCLCRRESRRELRHNQLVRGLAYLGTMSYSLYLVHNPAMVAAKRLAMLVGVQSVPALTAIRFSAALLAGYLFFMVVERKFLKAGQGLAAKSFRQTKR